MSFLNPVNEPVLRFSSTDASAPQINYAARTAGDVKTVLKACLVTGYGAKSSAGWSIANEINHVVEFVSPSPAMSDYRLGIDDTSASSTTWYYQYQDVRTNPVSNSPTKAFNFADQANTANGWQLLVTERGIVFIELVQHEAFPKLSARITYWGAVKSALNDTAGKNICFFNIGHAAKMPNPSFFYSNSSTYLHTNLAAYTSAYTSTAMSVPLALPSLLLSTSVVDLSSPIYLVSTSSNNQVLLAELPPMLSNVLNSPSDLYGASESLLDGRNVLSVCAGYAQPGAANANSYSRAFLIRTDYWEY